jgi:hypothetical protein
MAVSQKDSIIEPTKLMAKGIDGEDKILELRGGGLILGALEDVRYFYIPQVIELSRLNE